MCICHDPRWEADVKRWNSFPLSCTFSYTHSPKPRASSDLRNHFRFFSDPTVDNPVGARSRGNIFGCSENFVGGSDRKGPGGTAGYLGARSGDIWEEEVTLHMDVTKGSAYWEAGATLDVAL
jgi:hypothetical protein